MNLICDCLVIGSGPGGSITACYLSEFGRDVILVEEGMNLSLEDTEPFSIEEINLKYRNGGLTVALGPTRISYVEAKVVGGGSEINSGLYHRTPLETLETWKKEFQLDSMSAKDLNPHYEILEADLSVSPQRSNFPPASLKLKFGAEQQNWRSIEVPRWYRNQDSLAVRQSMSKTFIPRFVRANGRLLSSTRITELRREKNSWVAKGEFLNSKFKKENVEILSNDVFVAAGAIQTPTLLRRSGISKNVGNQLQLHPTLKVVATFPDVVNSPGNCVPAHQVKEFSPRFSFGCSISNPPFLAAALLDHPSHIHQIKKNWSHMAIYYVMIRPKTLLGSGGSVRPITGFRDPLVHYNLSNDCLSDMADGLQKLCKLLFSSGATELFPCIAQGPVLRDPLDCSLLPKVLPSQRTRVMTIHLFSSCPMGENQKVCATDSFGRIHGQKGLYVNDASLLCSAPGVNPQGSVMAVARRNVMKYLGKI